MACHVIKFILHTLLKRLNGKSSKSCVACCDRNCLLSTRKFVWVFLGSGLVSPGPKQIQPAAGFLLWFVRRVRCIPTSPSQCTFPVPVSCWISKCYRDSSRDTTAAQVVSVTTSCTCFLGLLAKRTKKCIVLERVVWKYWKTYSCQFSESKFTVVGFNEIWKGREFIAMLIFHCTKSNRVCHFISWNLSKNDKEENVWWFGWQMWNISFPSGQNIHNFPHSWLPMPHPTTHTHTHTLYN